MIQKTAELSENNTSHKSNWTPNNLLTWLTGLVGYSTFPICMCNVQNLLCSMLSRMRGLRDEYNGFRIGWLDVLTPALQLQSIIAAHNQWLSRLAPSLTGLRVSSLLRDWLGSHVRISHFYCACLDRRLSYEWIPYECRMSLSLSLMLRLTVSRPVCLGIKHPSWAYDQIFITVRQLRVCWCGALSLTRWRRVCRLQLLLSLASAVILGSESHYCLRFDTSIFVASYDSQGYGRGIKSRLHTGYLTHLMPND
jgi:hypothetical protein